MKFLRNITLICLFIFLNSCGTIKDGFSDKKNNSDEFLVEKKSPLVMPPDYNELPQPTEKVKQTKRQRPDIKKIITGSENKKVQTGSNSSIEELILKEINKD